MSHARAHSASTHGGSDASGFAVRTPAAADGLSTGVMKNMVGSKKVKFQEARGPTMVQWQLPQIVQTSVPFRGSENSTSPVDLAETSNVTSSQLSEMADRDGQDTVDASQFEGAWQGCGVITGNAILWLSGRVTKLLFQGRGVEMMSGGQRIKGELKLDDRIYWEDGDVWIREPEKHTDRTIPHDQEAVVLNDQAASSSSDHDVECCVCFQPRPDFTPCGHPLCRPCLSQLKISVCPLCRSNLEFETEDPSKVKIVRSSSTPSMQRHALPDTPQGASSQGLHHGVSSQDLLLTAQQIVTRSFAQQDRHSSRLRPIQYTSHHKNRSTAQLPEYNGIPGGWGRPRKPFEGRRTWSTLTLSGCSTRAPMRF